MSKSPFIRAIIKTPKGELDLSGHVTQFEYEDDLKKGNIVAFKCYGEDDNLRLANNPYLVAGAIVQYSFGLTKGVQSNIRLCRIANVHFDFQKSGLFIEFKCTDKGIEMKKGTENKIYYNASLSDIAQDIATKYGLNYKGPVTTLKHSTLVRTGETDMRFLQSLMLKENKFYHLRIEDRDLILEADPRNKNAVRSYVYGENVIDFSCSLKEITAEPNHRTGLSIDDKTGKMSQTTQNNLDAKKQKTEGKYDVSSVANAKWSVDFETGAKELIAGRTITGAESNTEKQNKANNLNEKAKGNVLEGKLMIEIDPFLRAGDIITIQLPVDKISGNWQIHNVTHKIDGGGAFTELEVNRTGTDLPLKATKKQNDAEVNKSKGNEKGGTRIWKVGFESGSITQ